MISMNTVLVILAVVVAVVLAVLLAVMAVQKKKRNKLNDFKNEAEAPPVPTAQNPYNTPKLEKKHGE